MLNVSAINGRLVADPELRHTQSGTAVSSFTVAVDRSYCKQGEERQCDFIDCVAWRGTAEFLCKYFHKGQMIAVNGRLQSRTYTDKDGNKRKATEIVADSTEFCGSKKDNQAAQTASAGESYRPVSSPPPNIGADEVRRQESDCSNGPGSKDNNFTEVPADDDLPF